MVLVVECAETFTQKQSISAVSDMDGPPPTRHAFLYFPDGDLVLMAAGRDGKVAFRIHSSVLGRHSPVFADMMALPMAEGTDKYDGIPSVDLQDDPHDFELFLSSMYKPGLVAPTSLTYLAKTRLCAQPPTFQALRP